MQQSRLSATDVHSAKVNELTLAMFGNKSAWFSGSVPQACQNFWISEGGIVACWRKADYLFSEDATCPDTLRIFESEDYLWDRVVVFHCLFLSTCEKRQSVKSVSIGHYVLPPASVQDEVRNVVGRLIWEYEDEQSVAQAPPKRFRCQTEDEHSQGEISRNCSKPSDTNSSESKEPRCSPLWDYPTSNMLTGETFLIIYCIFFEKMYLFPIT